LKKKLYFDKTVNLDDFELFIYIFNGKLREYHGFDLATAIISSIIPNGNPENVNQDYHIFEFDSEITLTKVSKYDRKKLGTKANYKIDSTALFEKTLKDVYIKLNAIEKFIIDYDKGKSILHRMKFKEKLIYFVLISIPSMFLGYLLSNWTNKSPDRNNNTIEKRIIEPDSLIDLSSREKELSRLNDSTIDGKNKTK
jgi:hypothetical protein